MERYDRLRKCALVLLLCLAMTGLGRTCRGAEPAWALGTAEQQIAAVGLRAVVYDRSNQRLVNYQLNP